MNALIKLTQLPVIEECLRTQKDKWEQMVSEADAMVCTEDTVQSVKAMRSRMKKEFDEAEAQRKTIKQAIMAPYNALEAVYRECITDAFSRAYEALSGKILAVEETMKRRCEDSLREYFAELCAVRHLDWMTYEQAGIKVDMASAKSKTPKRLRDQLTAFVTQVGDSVDRINLLDDAEEIMVEYQQTLDAAGAICAVKERHRRIEEQKAVRDASASERELESEMVRRVEALAPPVVVPAAEETIKVSLVLHPTRRQYEEKIRPLMRRIKEICDMEGIKYE